MKPPNRLLPFATLAAVLSLSTVPAHAVIGLITEHASEFFELYDDISSTDLIQAGSPDVWFVTTSLPDVDGLFDGAWGGSDAVWWNESLGRYPATVTINLNTLVKPEGYDITGVSVFCGAGSTDAWLFGSDEISYQRWTMEYSVVGDASFTELLNIDVAPESSKYASKVTAVLSGFSRPTGVDALRFTFLDPPGEDSATIIGEIDVFGPPLPVPEPSSVILGLVALPLVLRRKRTI
jgi:hypothetical protein